MRVLIVGPATWVRDYVKRMLVMECGHLVTCVQTAEDGLRALHAVTWDALVTDVRIDEDIHRALTSQAPRWQTALTVRMIQGRLEDFTRTRDGGTVPIAVASVAVPENRRRA